MKTKSLILSAVIALATVASVTPARSESILEQISVSPVAELRLSKNIGLGADYTVREWFKDQEKDSLARALVNISF